MWCVEGSGGRGRVVWYDYVVMDVVWWKSVVKNFGVGMVEGWFV